ncbi:hypothetical protein [Amycolatopsis thermoflava]|uniref:hypothetical protein n=1 Tax=Amycolatopsis thermoflava TaxID=84480 RepID=UPI003F4A7578
MNKRNVHIEHTGGRGKLVVDGHDISRAVISYELHARAGHLPQLWLTLHAPENEIDGEMDVRLTEPVRTALVALGWIPPEESA